MKGGSAGFSSTEEFRWDGLSALAEEAFERHSGQDGDDAFGGVAVTVYVLHGAQALAEVGLVGERELSADGVGGGFGVEDVGTALASLLAYADVDDGAREGGSLHDAAAGVADECGGLAQQAPVGDGRKVDEEMCVGMRLAEGADVGRQMMAAGIGVGKAEDDLAGEGFECREYRVGFGGG